MCVWGVVVLSPHHGECSRQGSHVGIVADSAQLDRVIALCCSKEHQEGILSKILWFSFTLHMIEKCASFSRWCKIVDDWDNGYKCLSFLSFTPNHRQPHAPEHYYMRINQKYDFSRPLIGPQVTWSDPGLSLVDPFCWDKTGSCVDVIRQACPSTTHPSGGWWW